MQLIKGLLAYLWTSNNINRYEISQSYDDKDLCFIWHRYARMSWTESQWICLGDIAVCTHTGVCVLYIYIYFLQIKNFKLRHVWHVVPSPVASGLNRFLYPLSFFLKPYIMGSFQSIILRCVHVKQIITLSAGLVLVIVGKHQADYRITDYLILPDVLSKALFAVASFNKAML